MIHVIAMITTKPGERDAVLAAFAQNVAAVHAEPGCIEYGAVIDTPGMGKMQASLGEDSFAVIERWESPEALQAHAASAHMAAYAKLTRPMIASRAIHILSPV